MGSDQRQTVEHEGELFTPTWQMTWIEVGNEVAQGSLIVPFSLPPSNGTIEYASLHLALDDLQLARESFSEAQKLGLPSDKNLLSKALIHAGVMAYARSFAGGVRGFRLTDEFFSNLWSGEDLELHKYLYNLRDKHIAHSVNEFEQAATVGVVVTDPSLRLLGPNPSGIGITKWSMVGPPMSKLKLCPGHIDKMLTRIEGRISELNILIHNELRPLLVEGIIVQPAPIMTLPDRSKVSKRRT